MLGSVAMVRFELALTLTLGLALGCGGTPERKVDEPSPQIPVPRGGTDRVGAAAPSWGEMTWLNSDPLTVDQLQGKVVLIRFWTDTCPFCRATAPALAQIDATYRDRGVVVIGMYHPKPRGKTRTEAQVHKVVEGWGWQFPVALDLNWQALDAFWLKTGSRRYTSVSFILDAEGIIRFVHPGPEFHPAGRSDHERCRQDYQQIVQTLEALLAQNSTV